MALTNISARLKNKSRYIAAGTLGLVGAVVVAGAIIYPGFTTANVNLNDGSVWVTNKSKNLVGHLNYQSQVLDGGFNATTSGFDVLQQASNVFMNNDAGSLLSPVSVPDMALQPETKLGGGKQTSLGNSVLALVDRSKKSVWATTAAIAGSFDDKTSKPILIDQQNPAVVVGFNDTVYAVDGKSGTLTTTTVDDNGQVKEQKNSKIDGLNTDAQLQITVVGDKPVVFDSEAGKLYLPGNKTVNVNQASGAKLQQHGTEANFVAIGTSNGLISQPLDGSSPQNFDLKSSGLPAEPIQQGGCIHMAWSGVAKYLHYCQGGENTPVSVPQAPAGALLTFRQNRDVVVLNDTNGGKIWLVNNNMVLVDNWQDLETQTKNNADSKKDSADPNFVNTLPDRTKPNRPPEVKPDQFGVRAGRTTLLPVLYNDSDPDGDVLTVQPVSKQPEIGQLQTVYGGTGLQVTVPANTTITSDQYSYTAEDGRGGSASAPVSIRVVPESENSPPTLRRNTTLLLEQGQSLTQNVLTDWIDPDGDDVFLVSAKSDDDSATIKTTPSGELTYDDLGKTTGIKTVTLVVSDGRTTTTKQLKVNVKPSGGAPPVANADFFKAVAGQQITIAPLKNDVNPSGGELRLASVERNNTVKLSDIADDNTFTFTGTTAGSVYLTYQVSNGPQSATGLIRIEVTGKDQNSPPVAVKDMALLPAGGSALVDALANDTDPGGGVLVLKSVQVPAGSPISATVLDHNVVKVNDLRGLNAPVELKYTVANSAGTSTGVVSVMPIQAPSKQLPPVAKPDEATVRVGDVVNIKVLGNDIDPNGQPLKSPKIISAPDPAKGKLFVDQDQLRFLAGSTAGTFQGIYEITNASGQKDSAAIVIHVLPADPSNNSAPTPKPLTGRVIAGTSQQIQVPLDGIDSDGDSVELVGIDSPPSLGTATVGSNYISYLAAASSSGTDTFTYRVRDRLGAESTGTVRVGVAAAEIINHPPVANDDEISMRPGRNVALDVLLNDSDPDGDVLAVDKNGFTGPDSMKPRLSEQGRVILTSPTSEGTYTMNYTITDGKATARANIKMKVTATAPLRAPIGRDDHVTEQETLGKTAVDVPVLKNDEDPDGVADELKLSFDGDHPTASVGSAGNIHVTLTKDPQLIPYTVTDVDGLKATAIIWVPGLGKQYPVLSKNDHLQVVAGKTVTMDLNEWVKVRDGHSPKLTQVDKIALIGADKGSDVVAGNGTGVVYHAKSDFYGVGSITFEVMDGSDPQGEDVLKSTLTVLVDVKADPSHNRPPQFTSSSVEVAKGETKEVDLSTLAKDPDQDDNANLKFSLDGEKPAGFDVDLNDKTLKLQVKGDVKAGANGIVPLKVTDGKSPEVKAQLTVVATSTNKPLAVANDDFVDDAQAGKTNSVAVLANDVNPFPETPLSLSDVVVEVGGSAIATSIKGDKVDITSNEDFKGTVTVRYTVEDATGDSSRRVQGRIHLNVKGKPEPPTAPRIVEAKDKSVLLNWAPSADNGSPITSYTVRISGGGQQECASNTCLITGLTNGRSYTFSVIANNAVGASGPSSISASATPDRAPDAPAAPSAKFGDKQITVNWSTPVGDFTPVTKFNVQISPAPAGQNPQKTGVTGNSLVWSGLSNGTAYTFRVQAINKAKDPSAWSAYSAKQIPAGPPAAPAAPTSKATSQVGNSNQAQVNWTAPDGNGDNNMSYVLRVYRGGSVVQTLPATTATAATVTLPNAQEGYFFSVTARNKAGTSASSPQSAEQRSISRPGTVGRPNIAAANTTGSGQRVKVNFSPLSQSELHGSRPNEITYYANVSPGGSNMPVNPGDVISASNGNSTTVSVYAVSSAYAGGGGNASAPSNAVVPYGSPKAASVSGQDGGKGDRTVGFTWSAPDNADVKTTKIRIDGGAWQTVAASGNTTKGGNYSEIHKIEVQNFNSKGDPGPIASTTAKAGPDNPPVTTVQVQAGTWHSCTTNGSDGVYSDNPATCDGNVSPGGDVNLGGHWLDTADGPVTVDKCGNPWGGGGKTWYHMTSGPQNGRWVKAATVDRKGDSVTCN
ncbi:Ig-like domain-containing protein [Psychromicrobium lacuslunae]|uniref:Ig-like domain-containing protein n=1 Tax=Psychromicrobium lacuslunae TaxID=1618207 RepID=UPI000698621D|nr:Ig-like domain-containing protein [Psychromicrobium lacuslunae]